jgi:hypothetical protein
MLLQQLTVFTDGSGISNSCSDSTNSIKRSARRRFSVTVVVGFARFLALILPLSQ